VLDQERVERDPVARVDRRTQLSLGFLGRARPDYPEPVRDPMNVRVDRDGGNAVPEHEDAVRRLGTDPGERRELVEGTRHLAAEPVEDLAGAGPDRPRLRSIEADRTDQRTDLARAGRGERRGVRESSEQPRRGDVGLLVPRALREDRSHEDLERVDRVVPKVRGAPISRAVERGEPVEDRLPVGGREPRGHRSGRPPGADRGAEPEEGAESGPSPGSERSGPSSEEPERKSSPIR